MPVECVEVWDPLGVDRDEPDEPVVGFGVGGLELVDVLDVGGDGELRVGSGVLTVGTLAVGTVTVGTLTDGVLTDGVLTDGKDNEDAAGGTAIATIAPKIAAPTDATSNLLPLDTSDLPAALDRPSRCPIRGQASGRTYPNSNLLITGISEFGGLDSAHDEGPAIGGAFV